MNAQTLVEFDQSQAQTYNALYVVKQAVLVPVPDGIETVINAEWGEEQKFVGAWYGIYVDGAIVYGSAKKEFDDSHGKTDEVENGYFKDTPISAYQYRGPTARVQTVLADGTVETENTISHGDWLAKWQAGEVGEHRGEVRDGPVGDVAGVGAQEVLVGDAAHLLAGATLGVGEALSAQSVELGRAVGTAKLVDLVEAPVQRHLDADPRRRLHSPPELERYIGRADVAHLRPWHSILPRQIHSCHAEEEETSKVMSDVDDKAPIFTNSESSPQFEFLETEISFP